MALVAGVLAGASLAAMFQFPDTFGFALFTFTAVCAAESST